MFQPRSLQTEELGAIGGGAKSLSGPRLSKMVLLIARRELSLTLRGRLSRGIVGLLLVVAFLPPLLLSLRAGSVGLATFGETVALALAFGEVALPLVGLLTGADVLAGESEDGTLVPLNNNTNSRIR
ncbi:MAG TPA: hypothetical protein VIX12_06740 [Candidatus Binataceae bacterium]